MSKEVSDKVIVIFIIVAVFISVLGTFMVYINANNPNELTRSPNVGSTPSSVGYVGVYVQPNGDNPQNGAS